MNRKWKIAVTALVLVLFGCQSGQVRSKGADRDLRKPAGTCSQIEMGTYVNFNVFDKDLGAYSQTLTGKPLPQSETNTSCVFVSEESKPMSLKTYDKISGTHSLMRNQLIFYSTTPQLQISCHLSVTEDPWTEDSAVEAINQTMSDYFKLSPCPSN